MASIICAASLSAHPRANALRCTWLRCRAVAPRLPLSIYIGLHAKFESFIIPTKIQNREAYAKLILIYMSQSVRFHNQNLQGCRYIRFHQTNTADSALIY